MPRALAFPGLLALAAALGLLPQARIHAAEVVVRNDSTVGGLPSTPVAQFLAGESVASWLTATCDGDIVAAQVYWASDLGTAPDQIEQSLSLFADGAHPTPGPLLQNSGAVPATIVGPTLSDAVMNEFRYLDPPTNSVPVQVPVSAGERFAVALKFFNQSSGGAPFAPAPVSDQDGCQPGTNAVDVLPGGWLDACPQGVTGDWVIRAVIDCTPLPVPATRNSGRALLAIALLGLCHAMAFGHVRIGGRPWAQRRGLYAGVKGAKRNSATS